MISPPPGLGTSMPTLARPGRRSTRIDSAESASARSSDRPMTWLTLIPAAGRNSYVVTTGPGWYSVTSPSTSNSAHLAAIMAARLGQRLAVDRRRTAPASRAATPAVACTRRPSAAGSAGLRFLLRRGGRGRLRPRRRRGRLPDRELARPGHLAHDRRRVVRRERESRRARSRPSSTFSRCLVTTVRRRRSLVRRSRWRAQPTVSRRDEPGEADAQPEEHVPERDLCRQRHGEQHERRARTRTAPGRPDPARGTRRRGPGRRCRPVSVSSPYIAPAAEHEREQHRQREEQDGRCPAALDAGLGSGRPQNRRQPRTKTRAVTPQAARPKSA